MLSLSTLFLSFSTMGLEITEYFALVAFLLSGNYREKFAFIQKSSFILSALAMYLLLILWTLHSPATHHEIFLCFSAYEKLLLIPVGLWTLSIFPGFKKSFLVILSVGILINFVLEFFKFHHIWPTFFAHASKFQPIISSAEISISHAALSYFASVLIFGSGVILIHQFKGLSLIHKTLLSLTLIISLYYLLTLSSGRSGLLTLAVLILYVIIRAVISFKSYKTGISILILMGILILGGHHFSHQIQQNLTRGTADLQQYENGEEDTSWGIRFVLWHNALKLISHHPFSGYGTGGFSKAYLSLNQNPATQNPAFVAAQNPHDQYLLFSIEQGLLGLLAFLSLLYFAQKNSISLSPKEPHFDFLSAKKLQTIKLLIEGSVLAFAIGCLYNSWLHDVHEGFFTIFLWIGLRAWLENSSVKSQVTIPENNNLSSSETK